MRPDKYGYFWYLVTYCPEPRIAEVIGNTVKTMDGMILDIDIFERDSDFKCWLGKAHPPKKVNRYTLETEYDSGGPTTNKEMVKRNVDESRWPGEWVRYDDVKEFLIGE